MYSPLLNMITSAKMNVGPVLFVHLFSFLDGHHFLVLIEPSYIENLFEIDFLRYPALPLRRLGQLFLELGVELVKVLPLLGCGHEEELGELGVAQPELLLEMHRHGVNIVGDVEVVVILLHLLVLHDLL